MAANGFQPEDLHPHGGADHLLLGDVHLEVPLGVRLAEELGEGRVVDLAVERDDARVGGAEACERLAVGLPRRDLRALLVPRPLGAAGLEPVRLTGRLRHLDPVVAHAAELAERLLRVLGRARLPVPAGLVLDLRVAAALLRARDDRRRPPLGRLCLGVRRVDRLDVVPVDLDRVPAEGLEAARIDVEVPAPARLAALAEPVAVDDRREVVEPLEAGRVGRLPDRPFRELAVAADDPGAERQPVELLAGEREADADREPLPERPGRDVDPREDGRRMALEPRPELPVGHELVFRDRPGGAEQAVDERRGVALREDQPVVRRALRIVVVVAEVPRQEDRGEVGRGHGRGGVSGAGGAARTDGVCAELLPELTPAVEVLHEAAFSLRVGPETRRVYRIAGGKKLLEMTHPETNGKALHG